MAGRSVSFGDVEEQVYEDEAGDYWDDNNYYDDGGHENADDYWQGDEHEEQQQQQQSQLLDGEKNDYYHTTAATTNKKSPRRNNNNNQAAANNVHSSLMCPQCGSRNIEDEPASGASICVECGVVVEENAIVSAVQFQENNGGASSMVGQFVAQNASRAYGSGGRRGGGFPGGGYSSDSREQTLARGRRRIQDVASRLRLGPIFVDAAHRLFTVAVEKNFVQGRRTTHVVAACLYISCRQEKSQHMLIDFSDALQVNVYTLGTTFLKFRRLLGLKLEVIDPALYVYRFAAHLDLDEKANAVALTALRLVGRMKRDWIVTGRRPAGICAAALLISARAHGFSRHQQDVTRILRVCGLTVNRRVKEFENTPSAALTLSQFNEVDLEQEMDPPRWTANKIIEARAKAIQEGNIQLLSSGALDDPMLQTKNAGRWRDPRRHNKQKNVKFRELYLAIDKELSTAANASNNNAAQIEEGKEGEDNDNSNSNNNNNNNGDTETQPTAAAAAAAAAGGNDEESNDEDGNNEEGNGADEAKPRGRLKDPRNYEEPSEQAAAGEEGAGAEVVIVDGEGAGEEEVVIVDGEGQGAEVVVVDGEGEGEEVVVVDGAADDAGQRQLVEVHPDLAVGGDGDRRAQPREENTAGKEAYQLLVVPEDWKDAHPKLPSGRLRVLPDHATAEEMLKPTVPTEAKLSMSEWKEALPDTITDEIDSMFRSDEEVLKKEVIFNKINKDYIESQERKEKERLNSESASKYKEDDEAGQAEAHSRYMKSNRGRKKKRTDGGDNLTTEEALLAAVNNRKISRKINYDAMSSIFDDDGGFATAPEPEETMEFGEL